MTIVTHADIRSIRYCNRGSREWFARHNLDWKTFVSQGLPVEAFGDIDDPMLKRAIEQARRREAKDDGQQ